MNTVSATSVPLFASLAMRANVAVAVDVAAAFAKAAHTLNIFNCCCFCCCDAALFKLDVDHSCALCFILFDTCTRVVRTYIYTCEYVCVCAYMYLQWRMSDCTHVNNTISESVSMLLPLLANRQLPSHTIVYLLLLAPFACLSLFLLVFSFSV